MNSYIIYDYIYVDKSSSQALEGAMDCTAWTENDLVWFWYVGYFYSGAIFVR